MAKLYNAVNSELIGEINEEQMELLIELLEEETEEQESYYIDTATLDYLEENGADEELLAMLNKELAKLNEEEGIEILIEDKESSAAS
jgi:uncharacterized protein YbcC (UPF0753/DUF2309 family)